MKQRTHAVIANGGTTSGEIDLTSQLLCGIIVPAAFTGTSLSFTVADEPGSLSFLPLYKDDGTQRTLAVVQGRHYTVNPADFAGVRILKIVSNAAEGADRTLKLVTVS